MPVRLLSPYSSQYEHWSGPPQKSFWLRTFIDFVLALFTWESCYERKSLWTCMHIYIDRDINFNWIYVWPTVCHDPEHLLIYIYWFCLGVYSLESLVMGWNIYLHRSFPDNGCMSLWIAVRICENLTLVVGSYTYTYTHTHIHTHESITSTRITHTHAWIIHTYTWITYTHTRITWKIHAN